MRCLIFLLAVICSSSAPAQVVPLRVSMHECDLSSCRKFTAAGSAVHLGRTEAGTHVFLTAAHTLAPLSPDAVLLEADEIALRVDDKWLSATLIDAVRSSGTDLAMLEVQASLSHLRCLPLLQEPLREGDSVYLAGFPRGGELRVIAGRVVRTQFTNHPLAIDQQPIQGESGGAVVIEGELAGIISGYPKGTTPVCLFTDAAAIREFVRTGLRENPLCYPASE